MLVPLLFFDMGSNPPPPTTPTVEEDLNLGVVHGAHVSHRVGLGGMIFYGATTWYRHGRNAWDACTGHRQSGHALESCGHAIDHVPSVAG